ncbi:MAG: TlpA family protein disulfide reductase [Phycisphaerales bacterium]|nr:TlpA family protein disulfide reductase [Phycisphaerales bacterium]
MKTRFILAAAAACSAMVSPAIAQQSDDAKASLAESTKAIHSIPGVSFDGKKYGTGMLKEIIDCEGKVKVWRQDAAKPAMIMVTGRIKQPAAGDKNLTFMSDGMTATWLEQKNNTKYERSVSDSLAQQEFSLVKQIMPEEFTSTQPYAQVLRMEKLSKLPNDNFKGEVCEVIEGSTADGTRTITWAISVADKLPRRMEMATGMGDKKISMILEMTSVNAAAKFTAEDFKISMPTGYVEDKAANVPAEIANKHNPNVAPMPEVEMGLKAGTAAPAFSFKSTDGKDVTLAGMKGDVVVLEFFGSMFKSSAVGSATLQAMSDEFKGKNVKFVGLACREANENTAKEYFKTNGLSYTLVAKGDAAVADYKVVGFPSYYVIDTKGNVAAFYQSFPGKDVMTSAVNQAMQAK